MLTFPIESEDALSQAFGPDGGGRVGLDGASFTKEQLRRFFPAAFYPVVSAEDLFGKMYAALHHGKRIHELEAELLASRKHVQGKGRLR